MFVVSHVTMTTNVSICVRARHPKPLSVPDTERIKDTKKLDYASTPLDANTLSAPVFCPKVNLQLNEYSHSQNNLQLF
jgi:hypothetical protein